MKGWQRWLTAPATHWLQRLLRQLHLWLGLGFGLYLLVISLSGSAIVLRPHFTRWLLPSELPVTEAPRPSREAMLLQLASVYPDQAIQNLRIPDNPRRPVYLELAAADGSEGRYYDPYHREDLGPSFPLSLQLVEWLTELHDELLLGRRGVTLNGLGGLLLLVMSLSGLLLWWPGTRRWRQALVISRRSPRSLLWQLHNWLGFWGLLLLLSWSLSAIYFAWPEPFEALIDATDPDPEDFERPDAWLQWLLKLHFGRFRSWLWLDLLWVLLGLLPAVLFVTACWHWCRRKLKSPA